MGIQVTFFGVFRHDGRWLGNMFVLTRLCDIGFLFYSFVYDTAAICEENFVGYSGVYSTAQKLVTSRVPFPVRQESPSRATSIAPCATGIA